mmetsp:Transcript_53802/g.105233  ORF Transcript_53802/g.105233 Transcript_53802/m.105233 type:complete len:359 (-) Transcript_53802:133-1209(-)
MDWLLPIGSIEKLSEVSNRQGLGLDGSRSCELDAGGSREDSCRRCRNCLDGSTSHDRLGVGGADESLDSRAGARVPEDRVGAGGEGVGVGDTNDSHAGIVGAVVLSSRDDISVSDGSVHSAHGDAPVQSSSVLIVIPLVFRHLFLLLVVVVGRAVTLHNQLGDLHLLSVLPVELTEGCAVRVNQLGSLLSVEDDQGVSTAQDQLSLLLVSVGCHDVVEGGLVGSSLKDEGVESLEGLQRDGLHHGNGEHRRAVGVVVVVSCSVEGVSSPDDESDEGTHHQQAQSNEAAHQAHHHALLLLPLHGTHAKSRLSRGRLGTGDNISHLSSVVSSHLGISVVCLVLIGHLEICGWVEERKFLN